MSNMYLIKNGRVVDPANGIDGISDVLIKGGIIESVKKGIPLPEGCVEIDAEGKIVCPGLIDMHVHLREPGREDKETVFTGTRAAIRGGVTTVLAMPNTEPAIDRVERVKRLEEIIDRDSACNVYICAAMTEDRKGTVLVQVKALKRAGVIALSDDGTCLFNTELTREIFKEACAEGVLPIQHCEDPYISDDGLINEGFMATKLGLRGVSNASEYSMVDRDIGLAKQLGCRVHIAHVSCRESVEIIKRAKAEGVKVTAEVTPHHFTLTEESLTNYSTNLKVNPPLRTSADISALKQGLKDGVIDVIASDHAPHGKHDKEVVFEFASFGMIGLETSLVLAVRELVTPGILDWKGLVGAMSLTPARLLGLDKKGALSPGSDADICIFDPATEWKFSEDEIISKSKNSPFLGEIFRGRVTDCFVGGEHRLKSCLVE